MLLRGRPDKARSRVRSRLARLGLVLLAGLVLVSGPAVPASATEATVKVAGSSWLSLGGVPACAPSTNDHCGGQAHVGGVSSNWWQCVELAQRLYNAKGWYSGTFSGVMSAYQIYDNATSLGMSRQANGSITSIVPGDMIVHTSADGGGDGHVSLVDSVSGSTVTVVEQNFNNTAGWGSYTLSSGSLSRSGQHIAGVVHDSDNTLTNGGGGSAPAVTLSGHETTDGKRHVFSARSSGPLYESWWPNVSGGVTTTQLASLTDVTAQINQYTSDGIQHVYTGSSTGLVKESWWPNGSGGVTTTQIGSVGTKVKGLSVQKTSDGIQHVFSVTQGGKVYETWWPNGSGGTTTTQLANLGAAATSVSSQVTSDGIRHVFTSVDGGAIYETYWPNGSGGVTTTSLASLGSSAVAISSQVTSDGLRHVYSATSGNVYETYWPNGSGGVTTTQIASLSNITSLSSQVTSDGTQHVYFASTSGLVDETWWNASSGGPVTTQLASV